MQHLKRVTGNLIAYMTTTTTTTTTKSSSCIQKTAVQIRWTSSSQPSEYINHNLHNGVGRYVCQLQRVTLKFCKEHANSRGIRDFIEHDLLNFARKNPGVCVYLQPKRHCKPKICAEYCKCTSHFCVSIPKQTFINPHKWRTFKDNRVEKAF